VVRILDVSMPLAAGVATWPGDPEFRRDLVASIERGDPATFASLQMSSHAGTHVDAPAHYLPGAATVDRLPLEVLVGPARVVAIPDAQVIEAGHLHAADPQRGERLLLRTANSDRRVLQRPFRPGDVALDAGAARLLAGCGIALLGVDSLTVGRPQDGSETHRILLEAGIVLVEGLDLADAAPGACELICLPLRIAGGDGAPARVLLRYGGGGGRGPGPA